MKRDILICSLTALAALALLAGVGRTEDTLEDLKEKAIKDAVKKVSESVVKIETSGGTEVVKGGDPKGPPKKGAPQPKGPVLRRGTGPTTGLIVSADGYVITSAFNFANNPASIRVSLPGQKQIKVARVVATDETRMLTLLKISDLGDTKLKVPTAAKKKEFEIGMTNIAVGRTLAETEGAPSVSVGILSAVNRIWGKAIQTDAKVSPANYGGPLVDLEGNVQGVLVPASPQAEGQLAGFEWYDSGIGFAIPLEDILAVLPRMMKGTEKDPVVLKRGYMGITIGSGNMFEGQPKVGTVAPGSTAELAGIKVGDDVKSIDGKVVSNYAEMLHITGGKYEGDTISLVLSRGGKDLPIAKLLLGSPESAAPQGFLGIIPVRDDPDAGVEIRYVYPKSGADAAKFKAGDRIMKITNPAAPTAAPVTIDKGRDQLASLMETARPGQELKVELKRGGKDGKTETISVKLGEVPETVPGEKELPESGATAKKAQAVKPAMKPETGLMKKETPAKDHTYHVYVPDTYDPNIACSVMIWLHPLGKHKDKDIEDFVQPWLTYADDRNMIIVCPINDQQRGWTTGDADWIVQEVRKLSSTYTIDRRRTVVHGMGVGGEMAYYLGFQARSLVRGVAPVGASMNANPREKVVNEPVSFYLIVGAKDPSRGNVADTHSKLTKFKHPSILREVPNMGIEYIDGKAGVPTLEELVRWIDSLDRM